MTPSEQHQDALPFELQPVPYAKLEDLHRRSFEDEYLPRMFAGSTAAAGHRGYEDLLAACRMIDAVSKAPTVLGLLTLGLFARTWLPGAYVHFVRVDGTELDGYVVDEAQIDGPLGEVLSRLEDKMKAHISVRVDLLSADRERRQPSYPLAALQQLVRNAIMHRTYEGTSLPTQVRWFSDRVEICSPGGPFGLVTPESFGQTAGTVYRNPHLADAMKLMGYARCVGGGIATARRLLQENGNPPLALTACASHVLATVKARAA